MNLRDEAGKLAVAAAAAKQQVEQATAEGTVKLKAAVESAQQSAETTQQQLSTAVVGTITDWQSEIAALGTSGMVITNALKDLPRTAQALADEMPKLARRLRTAGTRLGDAPRADADVMGLFDKIPGTAKLGVSEWDIRVYELPRLVGERSFASCGLEFLTLHRRQLLQASARSRASRLCV